MEKISLKKNFIMNCILTVSSLAVPFVTFPYVSRILLPEGIGRVSFATSVINYFLIFVQLGIPTYGIRAIAQVRDNRRDLSQRIKEILLINIFTCFIGYLFLAVFLMFGISDHEYRLLYCILGITLLTDSLGVEWLYKGLEQYRYMTIRSLFFKFLSLMGIFLFVKEKQDYLVYAFFSVFASAGSNLCNFIMIHKYVDREKIKIRDTIKHLKPILYFLAMSVAITVYTNLDNIMLGVVTDDVQVGYYSAVVKVRSLLLSIVTALGGVLLPRTSYYIERGFYDEFYKVCRKAFHFICLLAIPLTSFFMLTAELCVYILAGEEFLPAAKPLRWIMPTVFLVGVSNLIGVQMLIPLHKEKKSFQSVLIGAIVNFILNTFLITNFKASGAALATTVAEAVVLIVQIKTFEKKSIRELFCINWKPVLFGNFFGALACKGVMCLLDNVYICFLGAGAMYWGIYALLLWLKKDEVIVEAIESCTCFLKKKINRR